MIRNAFTADQFGIVNHYEPTFAKGCHETTSFTTWEIYNSRHCGGSVCLSSTITIDALQSLLDIIQGELTARAKSQLENQTA